MAPLAQDFKETKEKYQQIEEEYNSQRQKY